MDRREYLVSLGLMAWGALAPRCAVAALRGAYYDKLLVMVELKGGNDGLNTAIPYSDPEYYALRPRIAVPRDQVLQLDERGGLHPSLEPLLPLWGSRELGVIQGVGYPNPNLSHFRSIEIWDTASGSNEYLAEGWLARAFSAHPAPSGFAADGVVVGGNELGPLAGGTTRAIALADTEQFLRQAKLAGAAGHAANRALDHILKVESDIQQAAGRLTAGYAFKTEFPKGEFGNALKTVSQVAANQAGVAVVKVSLNGFDTHSNQPGIQARLLKDLAEGLAAFAAAMREIGKWDRTLVLSYAEFGRRPRENLSNGTDHGTASVHFALGGKVKGGLYGKGPQLTRLDGNGNLPFAVDFRSLYATVLEEWWGLPSSAILGGKFATLDLLRA